MITLGYKLSAEAFNILFNRFARHRKYMNIDDFAACLSRIKIMNGRTVQGWHDDLADLFLNRYV